MIEFRLEGVDGNEKALTAMAGAVPLATREALGEGAAIIEENMRMSAGGGRPGPNSRSGDLAASVTTLTSYASTVGGMSVEIGPTTAYGRRIELGFHGVDSIGRHYNQPPYPFVEPAVEESLDLVAAVVERAYTEVLSAAEWM